MRGLIDGLTVPQPIGEQLPALYQEEDDFVLRFCAALDEVIAPALLALDNFDAYLDPYLTPEDYLEWLAGWVGVRLDETWPLEKKRALVAESVQLYQWRGTRRGVAHAVRLYTGVEPEITDSGGVATSLAPGGPLPGSPQPEMVVTVRVDNPSSFDPKRVDEVVKQAKPAHVPHRVEIIGGSRQK